MRVWIIALYTVTIFSLPAEARGWGSCAAAARAGGPCGCVVANMLGLHDRALWAVSAWFRYPRTTPHVGAVAIWPGRHVELVTAVHGGTVSTRGSVGFSHVPIGRLRFVSVR